MATDIALHKLPDSAADKSGADILVGLVGRGIQLSRTPAMHEAEGSAQGLQLSYQLIDTNDPDSDTTTLSEIIASAQARGFAGLNITYPFKIDVMALLDELSEAARAIGAVNTVVFRDGRKLGHNSDLWGYAESFRRNMADAARDVVLLIGAGGAGAAVAHALIEIGVRELLIADTDSGRAQDLTNMICAKYDAGRAQAVSDINGDLAERCDGIVNATPVGMASVPGCPFPVELLHSRLWVSDIIYFPLETELLREARKRGCRTLAGDGMAVFQAVRAFELFTGIKPDADRMKAAFAAFDRIPAQGHAGQ